MAKILILANNDVGLYKFRKELIQKLINQGDEIYVSLPYGDFVENLVKTGCRFVDTDIDRRGINPLNDLRLLKKYLKIFKDIKPDVVITYTIKPNIYGGIISRFKNCQYAINITGLGSAFENKGILKSIIINLYKISTKQAKVVFFENEEDRRFFIKNRIVSDEISIKLNGAGVNLDEYSFCKYPKDREKIRFIYVGRIMKEKGIDELLNVAKLIKKEYKNVYFDLIGPMEDDYKASINYLSKSGIIKYYGYQSDVRPYIYGAHCFILPSYHEGMANTLLESGAMGRPLITSNIHGCKEAVKDGENGFLVEKKSSDDLYKKVKTFIELPYEEKEIMGRKSREIMKNTFDKRKVVDYTVKELNKRCRNL